MILWPSPSPLATEILQGPSSPFLAVAARPERLKEPWTPAESGWAAKGAAAVVPARTDSLAPPSWSIRPNLRETVFDEGALGVGAAAGARARPTSDASWTAPLAVGTTASCEDSAMSCEELTAGLRQ